MKSNSYTCLQITNNTVRVGEDSRLLPAVDGVNDPLSHPALPEAVSQLLAGVKSSKVFVSLSTSEALLKRIDLPDAIPDAEPALQRLAVENVLAGENHIPVPLNAAAYDFHLMSPTALFITWMRKKALASFCERFPNVVYVMPQPVAVANQLLVEFGGSERICGVYVEGSQCDLAVVDAGSTDRTGRAIGTQLYFGRSFLVEDSAQLWRTVQQNLANCPNPSGAALKRIVLLHSTDSRQGGAGGQAPENSASNTGDWQLADGTASQLGVEVTQAKFDWASSLLNETGFRLNLLNPLLAERAAARKLKRKRLLTRLIPIAACLLLLGANVKVFDAAQSTSDRIDALRLEAARVKTLKTETKSLQDQHAAHEKAIEQLAWSERRFPPLAERLTQIANQRPEGVKLTEIKTVPMPKKAKAHDAREALLVAGVAPVQSAIDAFRAALGKCPEFVSVRQVKTEQTLIDAERRLEFTLALESSGE